MPVIVERGIDAAPHGQQQPAPALLVTVDRGPLRVRLLSLGAAFVSVETVDAAGELGPVHLSLPSIAEYADVSRNPHLGATIGRYANRIGGAQFTLDGTVYPTDANRPPCTLHGGTWGFDRLVWSLAEAASPPASSPMAPDLVAFELESPDGDMGFPGRLSARVEYEIADTSITMRYRAVTDAPTIISLTNHGYWNLDASASVTDHALSVAASRVLVTDPDSVPTGEIADVSGTPLDLRASRRLGDVLASVPSGLDHTFVIDGAHLATSDRVIRRAAVLSAGSRWMAVSTDCPSVQVYTGNGLHPPFQPHQSVSIETQRLPDAPHHDGFGPFALRPGEIYESTTVLDFGTGTPPSRA